MRSRWALAFTILTGCAVSRQILAAPGDLADYRAFRLADRQGERLARAQLYLDRHPTGVWADEVRGVFDAEEGAWFEAAKTSRRRARDYLVDLPRGPHAEAARSLLVLFDEQADDFDTLELLAAARHTAATLDAAADQRRRVGDLLLEELAALLDPQTWGARLDAPPVLLDRVLAGPSARSWGALSPGDRRDELFFTIPTPDGAQARAVDVQFALVLSHGQVVEGRIEGEQLFVHWAEAMAVRVLDATADGDREAAAVAVADVLAGALEVRMPAARCAAPVQPGELLARGCDGWGVSVSMGRREGESDIVAVRGPQPGRAPRAGMR